MRMNLLARSLSVASLTLLACDGDPTQKPDASDDLGMHDAGLDAAAVEDADVADSQAGDAAEAEPDAGDLQQVSLRFKAVFGDELLACGSAASESGVDARAVYLKDLRVFLQDLALLRAEDQTEVPLELEMRQPFQAHGTVLLDFEDGSADCEKGNAATNLVVTGSLPRGSYRGIAFRQGVPEEINHQDPLALSPPLSEGPLHWGWLGGFLFVRAEFKAQDSGAVTAVHLGSTACTGAPATGFACAKSNRARVVLPEFDAETQTIVFDASALLQGVDLASGALCHGMGTVCAPFLTAFGISTTDGTESASQRVYRVE